MAVITNFGYKGRICDGLADRVSLTPADNKIIVYQGVIETNLTNWVEADRSGDELVSFTDFVMGRETTTDQNRLVFSTFPTTPTVNATQTGTAFWYAYVNTTSVLDYFFGNVTINTGNGSLHIDSLSLVSGSPVTIIDFGLEFNV